MKRLVAWGAAAGLAACQLVAGITDVSRNGPCNRDAECPANETCVDAFCKGVSSNAGTGAMAGGGGVSGAAADGGGKNAGGSSAQAGSSASGGGSGMSQAGTAAVQGGDGGGGGVSSGGRSAGGSGGSGDSGEGGVGDTTGSAGDEPGGRGGGGAGVGGAGAAGMGGVAGMSAGTGGGGMAGTGGAGPVRIMMLGDGITAGTCMRAFLWKELTDNAYPAFDFVGSRTAGDTCPPTEYDKNHEGHAGYRVTDLLSATSLNTDMNGDPYTGSSADLAAWFDGRPADIVLMLFGSNDFLRITTSTAADVTSAYSAILAKLRSVNPHVTLLVGLLPPMSSSQCNTSCSSRRSELNAAIPGWATTASSPPDSPVVVVDLTGMDVTDTTDGIKPNDTGAQFLADRWYQALSAL